MIWQPGTSSFLFRKPGAGGGSSVPVPTVYWEADSGIVTTTNGTTADASPVSGNKVLSWTSKDASASVASFGTNSQRPTYYNYGAGKPFVRFNGQQNQRLTASGPASTFNNAQAFTMGVAFRAAPIYAPGYRNQQYLTLDHGSANTNTLISQGGGMQFGFWSGNIGQRVLLNNSQQLWGETTYFGTFSTASSTSTPGAQSTKIYTGGTLAASNTTSTAGVSPCVSILIGGADATSGYSTINDYYGVYLYASELNASQISAVHNDISSRMFTWTTIPVAGAALWLDASRPSTLWDTTALGSNVYTNGGAVGQWNDLSGNARHAQQSSSANRPTWLTPANGVNGLGAASFNGTSQYLQSSYLSIPKTFIVVGVNSGTGTREWAASDSTNGGIYGAWQTKAYAASANLAMNVANTSGSLYEIKGPAVATNELVLHTTQFNGSSIYSSKNNGAFSNAAFSGTPATPSVATNIGAGFYDRNVVDYLSGKICEMIIFDSVLSSTDLTTIYNYLKSKWGTP